MAISLCCFLSERLALNKTAIVRPAACYRYEDMLRDIAALRQHYPLDIRAESIGLSREGRPIMAITVGRANAAQHVLIQAGIHGREHMTALLAMMQAERLLRCGMPNDFLFHFIPMANPDGIAISQRGASQTVQSIYQSDRAAGHASGLTATEYVRAWKANAAGVDLNRNFPAEWQRIHTRAAPSSEGYRGPQPQSEPETRALIAYTLRFPFGATISYHATGSEIFYEFGPNSPANEASLSLARAVNACTRYELLPDSGNSFGGYKDWAIQQQQIPSLTIEVGKGPTPLPLREYRPIWNRNKNVPYAIAVWIAHGQPP